MTSTLGRFRVPAIRSEINVTPLVDVCLVLLIIFMVVTPMLTDGGDIALPETIAPDRLPETSRQLDVAIDRGGQVFVAHRPVPVDRLQVVLQDLYERSPDRRVVIAADARLAYDQVRHLMRMLNRVGWRGAGIETRQREDVANL
jgi:biopolymer transport protein ExbD